MTTKMLHDLEVDEFLYDSVQIEPLQLQDEYVRLPADLAYWNQRYAAALKAVLLAKVLVKRTEARLAKQHRQTLIDTEGKSTEPKIEAMVQDDSVLHTAQDILIEAEAEKARIGGVCEAITAKKESLISIGAHVRSELRGDPSLRAQAENVRLGRDNERNR